MAAPCIQHCIKGITQLSHFLDRGYFYLLVKLPQRCSLAGTHQPFKRLGDASRHKKSHYHYYQKYNQQNYQSQYRHPLGRSQGFSLINLGDQSPLYVANLQGMVNAKNSLPKGANIIKSNFVGSLLISSIAMILHPQSSLRSLDFSLQYIINGVNRRTRQEILTD